jgi:transcriptional regulator with XRE-family HTH domain
MHEEDIVGRPEAAIAADAPYADFAAALRRLRAGQTYQQLADRTGYSLSALSQAASGRRLPSWRLTRAFVQACGGEEEYWHRRWQKARLSAPHREGIAPAVADHFDAVTRAERLRRLRQAETAAEFVHCLRMVKTASGLSLRMLETCTSVSKSALGEMLSRDQLPSPPRMLAFLHGCGIDAQEVTTFSSTHARLSDRQAPAESLPQQRAAGEDLPHPPAPQQPIALAGAPEPPPLKTPTGRAAGASADTAVAVHGRWRPLPDHLVPQHRQLIVQLRRLKDHSGLSLRALAAKTEFSVSAWERYLNGRSLPPPEAVEQMASVCGADPIRLLALQDVASLSAAPHRAPGPSTGGQMMSTQGGAEELIRLLEGLRELKTRTGLSLAALSAKTAYSKSSWERYFNGRTLPPRQAVQDLCRLAAEESGRPLALWELAEAAWSGRAAAGPSGTHAGIEPGSGAVTTRTGVLQENSNGLEHAGRRGWRRALSWPTRWSRR